MQKVIDPGKGHRFFGHHWQLVDAKGERELWDEEKYGPTVECLDDTFAIYRWLYRCKCGALVLVENVDHI